MSPSQVRTFPIAGNCGVPANATSVVVNITAVSPTASGVFQIFPGNAFPMETNANGFTVGKDRANNGMLMLSTDGAGTLGVQNTSAGSTHFVLDVVGYYL
jgi:hypothetical protein